MQDKDSTTVRRAGQRGLSSSPLFLCCLFILPCGCVKHETVTAIVFSPDGTKVAYNYETRLAEAAVDGNILSRMITLGCLPADSAGRGLSLTIGTLGIAYAEYVSVPIEVKWSPSGARIGVLTPRKLVIVDTELETRELRDGTITSFAWLSDSTVAYCARRTEGATQRRVVCRQRLDDSQAEDMATFAPRPADTYAWHEQWAPSGQFVIFVEPALGGGFQLVDVEEGTTSPVGRSGIHDCGVAWVADSELAFCLGERIGGSELYQAILLEADTGRAVDCSNEFQEAFGDRDPHVSPLATADGKYVLVNCVVGGGYLVQPEPWSDIPLGQMLRPNLSSNEAAGNEPWLFRLPVPGCVGVLPTSNEGDSPTMYAAEYSGERMVPLFQARDCWAVSPTGSVVATVGDGQRIEFLDLDDWWTSLVQRDKTTSPAITSPKYTNQRGSSVPLGYDRQ